MSTTIVVDVPDITTQIASYNTIRVWRTTDPALYPITGSPQVTTLLVAGQVEYEIVDVTGAADQFYRWSLYNSSSLAESDQSAIILPGGVSLAYLIRTAAVLSGLAFEGSCSGTGDVTHLIDTKLLESGVDAHFLEGNWIWRPDAAVADDQLRRVDDSGFDDVLGRLTPSRDWTNAPTVNERYYVFQALPPITWPGGGYSWRDAANSPLTFVDVRFVDRVDLGVGDGTTRRFQLGGNLGHCRRRDVRKVWGQVTDSAGNIFEYDWDKEGRWWEPDEETGAVWIDVGPAPDDVTHMIVEVNRTFEYAYALSDLITGPLELARLALINTVYTYLNTQDSGRWNFQAVAAANAFQRTYESKYRAGHIVRGI